MIVALLCVLLCVLAFLILLERDDGSTVGVEIQLLSDYTKVPKYKTEGAACADIYANLHKSIVLEPHCVAKIPTGFKLNIPDGFEVLLRPRSWRRHRSSPVPRPRCSQNRCVLTPPAPGKTAPGNALLLPGPEFAGPDA